jgi:hypothetical protein
MEDIGYKKYVAGGALKPASLLAEVHFNSKRF